MIRTEPKAGCVFVVVCVLCLSEFALDECVQYEYDVCSTRTEVGSDFSNGYDKLHDLPRIGCLNTAQTNDAIVGIRSLLEDDRHYTVQQLEYCMLTELCNNKISYMTIHKIVKKILSTKKCACGGYQDD